MAVILSPVLFTIRSKSLIIYRHCQPGCRWLGQLFHPENSTGAWQEEPSKEFDFASDDSESETGSQHSNISDDAQDLADGERRPMISIEPENALVVSSRHMMACLNGIGTRWQGLKREPIRCLVIVVDKMVIGLEKLATMSAEGRVSEQEFEILA